MGYPKFIFDILKFNKIQNLICPGDKIIISCSGGIDSSALVHFFGAIQREFNLSLVIAHFNHQVRDESLADQKFVQKLAQSYKLKFHLFSFKENFTKDNFQLQARNWRMQNLQELLLKLDYTKIATAHHKDDLAETVLWKIIRGSSIWGLNSLKAVQSNFIRPLLFLTKQQIKVFMDEQRLDWVEDKSNLESDKYTRNFLRHKIIPSLNELGSVRDNLSNLALDISLLEKHFLRLGSQIEIESKIIDRQALMQLPNVFAKEIIARFLNYHKVVDYNRGQIDSITEVALHAKQIRVLVLNKKINIKIDKNWIILESS